MSSVLPPPPVREGLLQLDPPGLLGSRCGACGTPVFPARDFCPACNSPQAPEGITLAGQGSVFSYTVVRQAPGGRPTPYVLAYVDLDEGVRVMAQVDCPPEQVRIGLKVGLVLRNIVPPPGEPRLGYAFTAIQTRGEEA